MVAGGDDILYKGEKTKEEAMAQVLYPCAGTTEETHKKYKIVRRV